MNCRSYWTGMYFIHWMLALPAWKQCFLYHSQIYLLFSYFFFLWEWMPPHLACGWILLSQFWSNDNQAFIKHCNQLKSIVRTIDSRMGVWFYYSLHQRHLVYLNGCAKSEKKSVIFLIHSNIVHLYVGNGCSPQVSCEWMLSFKLWSNDNQAFIKRFTQLKSIIRTIDSGTGVWFYYSLHQRHLVYLNGCRKTDEPESWDKQTSTLAREIGKREREKEATKNNAVEEQQQAGEDANKRPLAHIYMTNWKFHIPWAPFLDAR